MHLPFFALVYKYNGGEIRDGLRTFSFEDERKENGSEMPRGNSLHLIHAI